MTETYLPASKKKDVLFEDGFTSDLDHHGPRARWQLRAPAGLPHGDGITRTTAEGLVVVPTGTDPETGLPAFAEQGGPGHIRWAVFANHISATGTLGFPLPDRGTLSAGMTLSAELYNTARHPFGDEVPDPDASLRCGMACMICVDLASGIVFDFALTNRTVYALYERLPRPGMDHGTFSYAVPVAERIPGQLHEIAVGVDAGAGRARWSMDGAEVFAVQDIGLRLGSDTYLMRETKGPDERVRLHQMALGFGLFADHLWGQGARLTVRRASVTVTAPEA